MNTARVPFNTFATLYHDCYTFHGKLYFLEFLLLARQSLLVPKPLGFIPVMTLRFLHGVLVSFQCLSVLGFRCFTTYEHLLNRLK